MAKMNDMRMFCKYTGESDDFLINAVRSGDGDAFRVLAERCLGIINYHVSAFYLRKSVASSAFYSAKFDKDDLFQECCIALFRAVKHYDGTRGVKFATYANVCIKNRLISLFRKCAESNGCIALSLNDAVAAHKPVCGDTPAYGFEPDFPDTADAVHDIGAAAKLTALEKRVFILYLQGRSYKNISAVLNKNVKSVDNAVCRIKSKLQNFARTVKLKTSK